MDMSSEETAKGVTWVAYGMLHAPSFGTGGFAIGILIFIWRVVRNIKMFICMALGWALFFGTIAHLWFSHTDDKLPSNRP